jgi:hypothetical protein
MQIILVYLLEQACNYIIRFNNDTSVKLFSFYV